MHRLSNFVNFLKNQGLYPNPPIVNSPHAPKIIVNGKEMLMFATNNYLGLLNDPRVIEASIEGVKKWGIGNGSARLLTGNLDIHGLLERKVAEFKGREASLTFVSGYMANSGTIPAIVNTPRLSMFSILKGKIERDKNTIIFSDEYNHASIIAGIRMSGAPKEIYKHLDVEDLENRLKKYSKNQRKIIITDGVFSMDGDIAPLPQIVSLAKTYNAIVYLDDAHGTGILGPSGKGVEDYFGMNGSVDILMGTFTKSFGGVGGFVTGSNELIDYIKVTADSFIFTAPIAPPIVTGIMKAIDLAQDETWRRETVMTNAEYMKDNLPRLGIDYMNSKSQIIPIFIGSEKKAIKVADELLDRGIFIPCARWPAVPKGMARLRMTVSAEHTKEHMDELFSVLKLVKKTVGF
jgi:8-amino-7-oxononanoate synthase